MHLSGGIRAFILSRFDAYTHTHFHTISGLEGELLSRLPLTNWGSGVWPDRDLTEIQCTGLEWRLLGVFPTYLADSVFYLGVFKGFAVGIWVVALALRGMEA